MNASVEQDGADVILRIKAVPGAARDEIVGVLGDRLKIRITAPPEGGKANLAVCRLLAVTLGAKVKQITVMGGRTSPEKSIRIAGARAADVRTRLEEVLG